MIGLWTLYFVDECLDFGDFFLLSVSFVLTNSLVCKFVKTPFLSFARPTCLLSRVFQSSIHLCLITQDSSRTPHLDCSQFGCFSVLSKLLEVFILHFPGVCLTLPLFLFFSLFLLFAYVEFHFSFVWYSTQQRLKGTLM